MEIFSLPDASYVNLKDGGSQSGYVTAVIDSNALKLSPRVAVKTY